LYQLIEALVYLKNNLIVHRDLKLANLFVARNGDLKLGDFGLAAKLDNLHQKRRSICGTPNYIAPEILKGKGHSFPADVWAIGVLMYALLVGRPPFETRNISLTYKRIENSIYLFPEGNEIPEVAK